MKQKILFLSALVFQLFLSGANCPGDPVNMTVSVEWDGVKPSGNIEVINCSLEKIFISGGKGRVSGNHFSFSSSGNNRLDITLSDAHVGPGSGTSLVSVHTGDNSFSFFLRDITAEYPVFIPYCRAVVCPAEDGRTYRQTETAIRRRGLMTKLERIEAEPEESFDSAAVHTRDQICPTWLGISRDIRIFEAGLAQDMDLITPKMASSPMHMSETGDAPVVYGYLAGRGQGVENNRIRRLEDGFLPILNTSQTDEDIEYQTTTFVTLETSMLSGDNAIGTYYLVADSCSYGHMFTPDQKKELDEALKKESAGREETVLYLRVVAMNKADVPRYAWFRTLRPGSGWWEKHKYEYDARTGLSGYSPDRIFGISLLNGKPLPDEEIAVLLDPGESAVFEFRIPHDPVTAGRAMRIATLSFDDRLDDCKSFWKSKLGKGGSIKLPEKRIEEMLKAGLLHLDLITYGKEPDGTLAPSVGVYSPIGTESSPIMQFYMSMGWEDIARRSLMFFLDKQHEDGMIQNFGGYMVETGAALWSMGEYFRYTRDTAWVVEVEPKLLKACDFLFRWRDRNRKEGLRGKGYGMIDGKVADPEDPFHQYMLNGYGYLGVSRVAEMIEATDPANSERIREQADEWRRDIRSSFFESMAGSPVVPLGDGSWCPTVPPWTEARTMRLLYFDPETFLSHGTFTVSDAMLGPLYLVFCEVLDPREQASRMMLNYHCDLFYQRNAAFSQPYYSRHNWVQLKLGMVKPFLKTYYNTLSALADRNTYTFWEHLYKVSVHKTHEEAWFLMQTRWMLYMEEGKRLDLLKGIPRRWTENGKSIEVKNAMSYFGPISFTLDSHLAENYIDAKIECDPLRKPEEVTIRIPHPEGRIPSEVTGGVYDRSTESVLIKPFSGKACLKVIY